MFEMYTITADLCHMWNYQCMWRQWLKTLPSIWKIKETEKSKETLELRPVAETEARLHPLETEAIIMLYNGNEHLNEKQTKNKNKKSRPPWNLRIS